MNTDTIGSWAGLVWTALDEAGALGFKRLKKVTKLKERELYAAIGWLARENKINIGVNPEDEKEYIFNLI